MEHSNQAQLREGIIALSNAKTWEQAKREWALAYIELLEASDDPETCLCGHHPIRELCFLRNSVNRAEAMVGNVCVTKFFDLGSDLIFQGMKRVANDDGKALNLDATEYAHSQGWINDWERTFCFNTALKRKLSGKQAAVRARINATVLRRMKAARG